MSEHIGLRGRARFEALTVTINRRPEILVPFSPLRLRSAMRPHCFCVSCPIRPAAFRA
jgi:hypothetical protein